MHEVNMDFVEGMGHGLLGLQSDLSVRRLSLISELRNRGVGHHVNLPQLVVSGDQSTGKSSVLEGITGLPFPRQDGLCTRFPTEIILEHTLALSSEYEITAAIIPAADRDEKARHELQSYSHELKDFTELAAVITHVGEIMGLAGYGTSSSGPAFGRDILQIRVRGETGLNLSVVDLPGIIQTPNEHQDDDDVDTVHALVDTYAANPRTIILAVVQAGNDIANQPIIKKSKKFDKAGERTIGVITKPDLINEGTQARIAALARNEDTTKLKLGFFLLKNPSPAEMAVGWTLPEREKKELTYFASPPWNDKGLDPGRTGVAVLRTFLQDILDRHTERELPKVRQEISALLSSTEKTLQDFGEERSGASQMRTFLSRLAMRFYSLSNAALIGDYDSSHSEFFALDETGPRRLRAHMHMTNTKFSNDMRVNGRAIKVVTDEDDGFDEDHNVLSITSSQDIEQVRVNEETYKAWIKKIYANTRGRELPGNYNHVLLAELFHFQSRRWKHLAMHHVQQVYQTLCSFVAELVDHIIQEERVTLAVKERVNQRLSDQIEKAMAELRTLIQDEKQQPITYNHYYTDTIQRDRQTETQELVSDLMEQTAANDWHGAMHISNNGSDVKRLINALQRRVVVDMDEQACIEARAGLDAYYKVARKTFVDNICRQVIERHLLCPLPHLFSPEVVAGYDESDLRKIAAETPQVVAKRGYLLDLQKKLAASLMELRQF